MGKRRLRVPYFIAAVMLLHIAGCVIVPYPVSHEIVRADRVEVADQIYITVGPRELIDDVSVRIVKHNPNIELVDPLTFRDTAFPAGGWSLKELLESERRTQVAEQLDVQYLVLLTPTRVETGEEEGFLIPFLGAMAASEDSTLSAFIIDLRHGSLVSQLSAKSSGKGRMLYYVIFIVAADPMTESAVIGGLSESIAETLASESHSGRLRIAVLAGEALEKIDVQSSVPVKLSAAEWDLYKDIGAYCPNADLGHADAQTYVGDLHYLGAYDLEKKLIQAFVWYSLAANNGNSYAAVQLEKVVNELSPEQLVEAQHRLEEWQPGRCERDLRGAISEKDE